jgi:serine protease Do
MNGVDLNRFEFDYDTTWAAFFLDAELNVYSRYGGRDADSSDGRLSKDSLLTTMNEVLETHERRKRAPLAGELHPAPKPATTPEDIPLLAAAHQGCVHCHQVQEYRLLQAFHDGKFEPAQLFGYPLPENIGLRLDRKHGHRVEALLPDSPAAKAKLKEGDVVTRVNDVPVRSEQDIRWALHRADDRKPIAVSVLRSVAGKLGEPGPITVELKVGGAWRQTDLSWRKSLRSVPLPLGFLGYALGREEREKARLGGDRLAIKVVSIRGAGLAESLRLKKGDTIVAVEGNSGHRILEEFKSDLLRKYSPGDRIRLRVRREGAEVDLEGLFPAWHTTDTSVP